MTLFAPGTSQEVMDSVNSSLGMTSPMTASKPSSPLGFDEYFKQNPMNMFTVYNPPVEFEGEMRDPQQVKVYEQYRNNFNNVASPPQAPRTLNNRGSNDFLSQLLGRGLGSFGMPFSMYGMGGYGMGGYGMMPMQMPMYGNPYMGGMGFGSMYGGGYGMSPYNYSSSPFGGSMYGNRYMNMGLGSYGMGYNNMMPMYQMPMNFGGYVPQSYGAQQQPTQS